MQQDEKQEQRQEDEKTAGEMTESEIDETLKESFPASDPPSWTLGMDHGAATDSDEKND